MREGSRSTWPASRAAMSVGGILVSRATSSRDMPRRSRCWLRYLPKSTWSTIRPDSRLELFEQPSAVVLHLLLARLGLGLAELEGLLGRVRLPQLRQTDAFAHVRFGRFRAGLTEAGELAARLIQLARLVVDDAQVAVTQAEAGVGRHGGLEAAHPACRVPLL